MATMEDFYQKVPQSLPTNLSEMRSRTNRGQWSNQREPSTDLSEDSRNPSGSLKTIPSGSMGGVLAKASSSTSINSSNLSTTGAVVEDNNTDRYAGIGLGIAGLLADNICSHPCIVLRRQCQVNYASYRYHLTPFSYFPILLNLNRSQGISVLWKGIGSALTVRGLSLAVEDFISKFTPWPKEINSGCSLKMIGQHLMLKGLTAGVLTPFYSASLVESVQSDIASEYPGIFDVFREGFGRLINFNSHHSGRMLPVWVLAPPTIFYCVSNYIVYTIFQGISRTFMTYRYRNHLKSLGAVPKEGSDNAVIQYQEQIASLVGHIFSNILLYPIETILHRMYLQGCRTIIDNLDSGREVMPIMTRYEGFFDCLTTVLSEEGIGGLFKGFGSLIIQYSIHFAIIRSSAMVISEVSRILNQEAEPIPPNMLAQLSSSTNTIPSKQEKDYSSHQLPSSNVQSREPTIQLERDRSVGDFMTPTRQTLKERDLSARRRIFTEPQNSPLNN